MYIERNGLLLLSTLIATLVLVSCQLPVLGPAFDTPLPNRQIIFQLDSHSYGAVAQQVGFINADGSGLLRASHRAEAITKPQWAGENDCCMMFYGAPWKMHYVTANGGLHRVDQIPIIATAPVPGTDEAVVSMSTESGYGGELRRVNIKTGEILHTYEILSEGDLDVGSNAVYEQLVVYGRAFGDERNQPYLSEIVLRDMETDEDQIVLRNEFDNPSNSSVFWDPALSPDGSWIAYTDSEKGIFIIRPDGSDNRLMLALSSQDLSSTNWPTSTSWSPDSNSLIYHRCLHPDSCSSRVETYGIFKLDIETLEEELLVEGGLNPYWRLTE